MQKKIVLFDFDGTLMDSQVLYDIAASRSLLKINSKYTPEYCTQYFCGRGWTDVFKEIQILEPNTDVQKIFADALILAKDLTSRENKPTLHSKTVLTKLKQDGLKLAICSNSSFNTIKQHLALGEMSEFFTDDEIFALESVTHGKPAPDIYLKAVSYFNAKKKDCLIIEDSLAGLKAGSYAEIDTLFYTGGSHHLKNPNGMKNILATLELLKDNTVKGVISDLLEIYDFL
jgi:HAD superfamily hydrolase (TIGR01509 family)